MGTKAVHVHAWQVPSLSLSSRSLAREHCTLSGTVLFDAQNASRLAIRRHRLTHRHCSVRVVRRRQFNVRSLLESSPVPVVWFGCDWCYRGFRFIVS